MGNWFKEQNEVVKAATIGLIGVVVGALINGTFSLLSKGGDSKSDVLKILINKALEKDSLEIIYWKGELEKCQAQKNYCELVTDILLEKENHFDYMHHLKDSVNNLQMANHEITSEVIDKVSSKVVYSEQIVERKVVSITTSKLKLAKKSGLENKTTQFTIDSLTREIEKKDSLITRNNSEYQLLRRIKELERSNDLLEERNSKLVEAIRKLND